MLEIMQFYVSGFWTWAGLTVGLVVVASATTGLLVGLARAFRGK